MKRSKCMNLRITIILSVLLILVLAFIWGHSMFSAVDSAEESRRTVDYAVSGAVRGTGKCDRSPCTQAGAFL